MKTKISSLVPFAVDQSSIAAILTTAGISDIAISETVQEGNTITLTASRHLTSPEKAAVQQAIIANLVSISDA